MILKSLKSEILMAFTLLVVLYDCRMRFSVLKKYSKLHEFENVKLGNYKVW